MSGGNKRHRKKCRWNICHLGINVVQSDEIPKKPFTINQFIYSSWMTLLLSTRSLLRSTM